MDQLRQALAQAKDGHGQIVGVMGEPGLGKSRLFYEFKLTSQSGCLLLEAFSVSHGKATPYLPVIELLKNYFQIQAQDDESGHDRRRSQERCSFSTGVWKTPCPTSFRCSASKTRRQVCNKWTRRSAASGRLMP